MNVRCALALLVGCSVGLVGCGRDLSVHLEIDSSPPGFADVNENFIAVEEGLAVVVLARPLDDRSVMKRQTPVDLNVVNRGVLGVDRVLFDREEDSDIGDWRFVLFGVQAGATDVEVFVDDEHVDVIPAQVEPQRL